MKATFATILLMVAPAAFAQIFPAAPPVAQQGRVDVFDWRETPRGQAIPIVRAVFDSNGYLLTDENGQLISVPFAGNLYAMQFGKTSGSMYFVNDGGGVPTLYVPENGYLDNAVVADARWYPFPQRYFYSRPVFLGPAPSWNAYCDMGWYPGMSVYGGYWGVNPWRSGIVYSPMSCLTISWGTRMWNTWDDYCLFGRNYTVVRPIVIRDTRPIYVDQRDRFDRSRGGGFSNNKDWDRDRPTFRESARPGFQAPARNSEERAQGNGGGSDRFNYGSSAGTLGRSAPSQGGSREREYGRPNTTLSVPSMTPPRGQGGFTPPGSLGGGSSASSRERSYSVPNMTPMRPSGSLGSGSSGNGYPFPSRESRESRSGSTGSRPGSSSSAGPSFGRPSSGDSRPTGRTSSPPSSSGSSRESRSRERGKG